MSARVNLCALCGKELDLADHSLYRRVVGWERPGRGTGGQSGSSLVLREALPAFAHPVCVVAAQNGVHPDQTSLV